MVSDIGLYVIVKVRRPVNLRIYHCGAVKVRSNSGLALGWDYISLGTSRLLTFLVLG